MCMYAWLLVAIAVIGSLYALFPKRSGEEWCAYAERLKWLGYGAWLAISIRKKPKMYVERDVRFSSVYDEEYERTEEYVEISYWFLLWLALFVFTLMFLAGDDQCNYSTGDGAVLGKFFNGVATVFTGECRE